MQKSAILSQVFPARIEAVEALSAAAKVRNNNAKQLRDAASKLDEFGPRYGRASTATVYAAFAELLRSVAMLVEWRDAVLNAATEADRFLRSAKARHRQWQQEYEKNESVQPLVVVGNGIYDIDTPESVGSVCEQLARTPLPIGVFSDPIFSRRDYGFADLEGDIREIPVELAVAFLCFQIDGQAAAETHFLTPNETHDIEIEVRVSRWPEQATNLILSPITIEPRTSYEFPTFECTKPVGEAPFICRAYGRAILRVPQNLSARPYEFKYAAAFSPNATEQPVAVVGQRFLRIEGIDLARNPVTGYPAIDKKLLQIRDNLRGKRHLSATDFESLLTLLKPMCGLAGRAIQDALFKGISSESAFQTALRNDLRRDPAIGSELEEHPRAAGGITDLSYRGIRIELKFSDAKTMTLTDCERFIEQAVSYVVGTGKRIGILCVLDNSQKKEAPFPADEGITLNTKITDTGTVEIVTILIQSGLARPSDLSR